MSPKLLADVWLFVVCSPWRAPRWLGTPGKVPGNTCSLATWSTCSHRLPSARHCVPLLSRDSAASCSRRLCEAALSFHSLPSGCFLWTSAWSCTGLPLQGRSAWLTAPVPHAVMCPASHRDRGAVRAEASRAHVTGDSLLGHVAMRNVGRTWDLNVIGHIVRSTDGFLPGSGLPAMSSAV